VSIQAFFESNMAIIVSQGVIIFVGKTHIINVAGCHPYINIWGRIMLCMVGRRRGNHVSICSIHLGLQSHKLLKHMRITRHPCPIKYNCFNQGTW
jgi:hypothetical protein